MLLIALAGIPRGGVVTVSAEGQNLVVRAKGERAKINEAMAQALAGTSDLTTLDARLVQPYYARMLAEIAGLEINMAMESEDTVIVAAKPIVPTSSEQI
jgi:histidine phosphotransferase ChpT